MTTHMISYYLMKFQLFVDMDGVLADFDSGYEAAFGIRPSIHADSVDWELVRQHKDFYLNLSPMPDFDELWAVIASLNPIVLTGIPTSVTEACANKTAWVSRYMGQTEIRCCRSSEKYLNARPGDVLVDDWEKYRHKWEEVGGIWITHTDAASTIKQIEVLLS